MKKILLIILLFPLLTFAQERLQVGDVVVEYNDEIPGEDMNLFYQGKELVASEHGAVTLVYEDGEIVLEAHDTNGDGYPDLFLTIDDNEQADNISGERAGELERPEVVEFVELLENEEGASETGAPEEDLVGPLDSITIPGRHNYLFYIITILLIGGAAWWYLKGRNRDEE